MIQLVDFSEYSQRKLYVFQFIHFDFLFHEIRDKYIGVKILICENSICTI